MGIIELLVILAVIGFCLWAIVSYVPMPEPFRTGVIVLITVLVVLYVARVLLGSGGTLRLP